MTTIHTLPTNTSSYTHEHLTIHRTTTMRRCHSSVVILGNAYGILPYLPRVASALASRGIEAWWFAFSGQDGTPGTFSFDSAVNDVHHVLELVHADADGRSVSMLAHCAGALVATEYFHRHGNPGIGKLAFYGPLLNAARRRSKAESRLRRAGVNYEFGELEWHYPWSRRLPSLTVDTLFCHSRDRLNMDRATADEVDAAARVTPFAKVRWFQEGYDCRFGTIDAFVSAYASWFTGSSTID